MKRTLLITALMFCLGSAAAAEPTAPPKTDDAKSRAAGDRAQREERDARSEAARAELAEMRTQMKELSGKMAKLSEELGDVGPRAYAYRYLGDPNRAMIGVVLGSERKGARISAVTPDSPAARAGLRDGDVIVAINGKRFANAEDPEDGLREARELLSDLKEGQEVRLAYERGAKAQPDLLVKAARREAYNWPRLIAGDVDVVQMKNMEKDVREQVERARVAAASIDYAKIGADVARATADAQVAMHRAMPWWGLNLAPVNSDLGRYFGIDRGALVISANQASPSGLRGGDVITEVAGERVDDPGDALRALRDQAAGKDIPFKVLRERKTITLNVKAPEYKSIFSALPLPPAPPAPPKPAAPPRAPSTPPPPPPKAPLAADA